MHSRQSERMDGSMHDHKSSLTVCHYRMTNIGNAIDDRTENAKGLAISSIDGIQLGHRSVYEIKHINNNVRWTRNGVIRASCVLPSTVGTGWILPSGTSSDR